MWLQALGTFEVLVDNSSCAVFYYLGTGSLFQVEVPVLHTSIYMYACTCSSSSSSYEDSDECWTLDVQLQC